MNSFNCIFGRNVIAATLAVLMPICCCVLKTAAAMVSDGPEPIVRSCCANHCPNDDAEPGTDQPDNDCEGCCVKAPATVDHDLDDAFDQIAFQPELQTLHAEAIHDLPGRDTIASERGEPPPGHDPTRSARDLRRVVVLQR